MTRQVSSGGRASRYGAWLVAGGVALSGTAQGQECVEPSPRPLQWFPMDGVDDLAQVRDVMEEMHALVESASLPSVTDGRVGEALLFDGSSYLDAQYYRRLDAERSHFTVAAWVRADDARDGTVAAFATKSAPGSWRLFVSEGGDLVFEACDDKACLEQVLPAAVPLGAWTFVSASVQTIDGEDADEVVVELFSQSDDTGPISGGGSLPMPTEFGFNVPGTLHLGASMEPVIDDTEYESWVEMIAPVETWVGALDEVLVYDQALGQSDVLALAGAAPAGVCEACIHDVTPPALECPAPFSVKVGQPVVPPEIYVADDCEGEIQVDRLLDKVMFTEESETATLTYKATDKAGNVSSCSTEVTAAPAATPKTTDAIVSDYSCVVTAIPFHVVEGDPISFEATDLSFQCTNGTCDYFVDRYVTWPDSNTPVTQWWGGFGLIGGVTSHSGFAGMATGPAVTRDPIRTAPGMIQLVVTVHDHSSGNPLVTFSCFNTFEVQPRISSYCGQPLSYWAQLDDTNQLNVVQMDPQVWGNNSPWFDGTNSADLILGNQHNNKIRGHGGNDCLVGFAGNDFLDGQEGADRVEGGDNRDTIWGGSGNDTIWGGGFPDEIYGNGEPDYIYGGDGGDWIYGNGGNDYLWGDNGDDDIEGNEDADTIDGGNGNDLILGKAGGDALMGKAGCDTIEGDGGDDWIAVDGGENRVYAGSDNDLVLGGPLQDYFRGDVGNDNLQGNGGNDYMCGNGGADQISGGAGTDDCRGDGGGGTTSCDNNSAPPCNWTNWGSFGLWPCD